MAILLLTGVAWCGDFWEERPASAWTFEEALKLLTDSPWAHEESVAWMRSRGPGTIRSLDPSVGDRTGRLPRDPWPPPEYDVARDRANYEFVTARYLLRWESAAPVQQAFGRLQELGERATAHFQAPAPHLPADRFVITVKTTQPPDPHPDIFFGLSEEELCQRAELKTPNLTVTPVEVERSGVGAAAAVHFFFPRELNGAPLLHPGPVRVEFSFPTEKAELRTKFTLPPEAPGP